MKVKLLHAYRIDQNSNSHVINKNRKAGCAAAWIAMLVNRAFGSDIILEGDAKFKNESHKVFAVDVPNGADCLYIGISSFGLKVMEHHGPVVRLAGMQSTHGLIVLSERYRQHMIDCCIEAIQKNMHFDVLLSDAMTKFNVYALKQPLVTQGSTSVKGQPGYNRYYKATNITIP